MRPSPSVASAAPAPVEPRRRVGVAGLRYPASESTTTTAATGTLKKKSQRQDACAATQPPATGPMAAVMALQRRPGADGGAARAPGKAR